MANEISFRRAAVAVLAVVFGLVAVGGFFAASGWPVDVQAIDLKGEPADDETTNRRTDDDDDGLDLEGDLDDLDDATNDASGASANNAANSASGDGDLTAGDDGTAGGNNTANSASGDGASVGGSTG